MQEETKSDVTINIVITTFRLYYTHHEVNRHHDHYHLQKGILVLVNYTANNRVAPIIWYLWKREKKKNLISEGLT